MPHQQLVKDCLRHKRTAQLELYQQFAPQMLGVCMRYTKSIDDAEDVLQEGFVRVFTQLHKFRNEGELGGWIRRIMVNCALDYLKKHSRYRSQMQFEASGPHPVVAEMATPKLDAEALVQLIQQLPAGYQSIFNLVAVEGYNHLEVAELLGISENTSRSQYSRARALLMRWITEQEQDLPHKRAAF